MDTNKSSLKLSHTSLGIELGSTRIKAVLIGESFEVLASGGCDWENRYEDGFWTYHLDEVWTGIRAAYKALADDVQNRYGLPLTVVGSMGFSGMMHGFLVFDRDGKQLVSFRTWRNTTTAQAAEELTSLFGFNIPQRWSIAHLRQAMLNNEPYLPQIARMTTLAGYVHYMLTGQNVLGIGEASGMFPIDSTDGTYDKRMTVGFDELLKKCGLPYSLSDILPKVLTAGQSAGFLTDEGARLIDPTGTLKPGIPLCPPEGDAGTGMVATNSITSRTGNVSAGTSVFAMAVLEKPLSRCYPEIDMVTTPTGSPVAMVHCNNCTSDLNDWASVFLGLAEQMGTPTSKGRVLDAMFEAAMSGSVDCEGLFACNYLSGEHTTGFSEGRPMFARTPGARFDFQSFCRVQLFSAIATLKIGMDYLLTEERFELDSLLGHGGYFKAKEAGQRIMAEAIGVPVAVMETAAEGGAWGMAVLAAYMCSNEGLDLEGFLNERVFAGAKVHTIVPDKAETESFNRFIRQYKAGLGIERAAVEYLK